MFTLPNLPYAMDALAPRISKETLEYHYGKHHKTYVDKLNTLVPGTPFENQTLEQIIQKSEGPIFNNAAQVWNHTFYWHCLSPKGGGEPTGALKNEIEKSFGTVDKFREDFISQALALFGSGWTWLVKNKEGKLGIQNLSNAGTPVKEGIAPLLTCDVWEHAYYIDFRNDRKRYVETFWGLVDWNFVSQNLQK